MLPTHGAVHRQLAGLPIKSLVSLSCPSARFPKKLTLGLQWEVGNTAMRQWQHNPAPTHRQPPLHQLPVVVAVERGPIRVATEPRGLGPPRASPAGMHATAAVWAAADILRSRPDAPGPGANRALLSCAARHPSTHRGQPTHSHSHALNKSPTHSAPCKTPACGWVEQRDNGSHTCRTAIS